VTSGDSYQQLSESEPPSKVIVSPGPSKANTAMTGYRAGKYRIDHDGSVALEQLFQPINLNNQL
jgi:hypothetical protein